MSGACCADAEKATLGCALYDRNNSVLIKQNTIVSIPMGLDNNGVFYQRLSAGTSLSPLLRQRYYDAKPSSNFKRETFWLSALCETGFKFREHQLFVGFKNNIPLCGGQSVVAGKSACTADFAPVRCRGVNIF